MAFNAISRRGTLPTATFDITIDRAMPHLVAPFAFWAKPTNLSGFSVSEPAGDDNIFDPTQHDITWIWHLSGAAYTPKVTPDIPTGWRDILTAYGKMPSFVIPSAGDWTLTCYAQDIVSGAWGMATYTFEADGDSEAIVSADSYFSGSSTICVSQASDFTGKPTGATETTSISAAITAATTAAASTTAAAIKAARPSITSRSSRQVTAATATVSATTASPSGSPRAYS
jgi:hypothetical protein